MSKDGYLPDGIEDHDIPGYLDDDHYKGCPVEKDGTAQPWECICPSREELKAEAEEAKRDARRDES